jgi:hypothetical protein
VSFFQAAKFTVLIPKVENQCKPEGGWGSFASRLSVLKTGGWLAAGWEACKPRAAIAHAKNSLQPIHA